MKEITYGVYRTPAGIIVLIPVVKIKTNSKEWEENYRFTVGNFWNEMENLSEPQSIIESSDGWVAVNTNSKAQADFYNKG